MDKDNISLILQTLETQLNQRLEKLWRVFNWCSSILISITAGLVAATATDDFDLKKSGRVLVSNIIIIVTIYSWAWIKENLKFEGKIRSQIDIIFKDNLEYPAYNELRPDKAKFGYKNVILLLWLVALAATWVDFMLY